MRGAGKQSQGEGAGTGVRMGEMRCQTGAEGETLGQRGAEGIKVTTVG